MRTTAAREDDTRAARVDGLEGPRLRDNWTTARAVRSAVFLLLVGLVLWLLSAQAHAAPSGSRRQIVISGNVTDTQGRPVGSVLISVPALNESTVSDERGAYRLVIKSRVRSGSAVVIRASRKGYNYVSRSVRLNPGVRLRIDFRLAGEK